MRKIAIIGSGQAGTLCAHGLRRAGHAVTLYSDRTPQAWLTESRPTGAAGRLGLSLAYERELGLNHWEAEAPMIRGAHMTLCPSVPNRLLTMTGRLKEDAAAIDVRLQSHRWMIELEKLGGKIEIENVTVPRLEEIAAEHDLTLVATGKGGLAHLFERDEARSVHAAPQRQLAMLCVKGVPLRDPSLPFLAVKFVVIEGVGEVFWLPYHHKDAGPSHVILSEAIAGGPLDRFQRARSARDVLEGFHGLMGEVVPWEKAWFKDAEPSDELGWLVGSVRPEVKSPVGRLPSSRLVMPLGDTAVTVDPIAGQGANNGNKMAKIIMESVAARGELPFDEAWMTATFERFWERHGRWSTAFTRLLLEPATPMAKAYMVAQYGSDGRPERTDAAQALADLFAENFNDPAILTPHLLDEAATRAVIRRTTGSFALAVARNVPGIVRAQVRQRLGKDPGHPRIAAG